MTSCRDFGRSAAPLPRGRAVPAVCDFRHTRSLARLLALVCAWGASSPCAQNAVNPLRGDLRVRDPVMIKSENTYFVFGTGNGVSVKTSTDRINWRNAGRVIETMPAWHQELIPENNGNLWAPDIHHRDGKYWLYYSVSTLGSITSAIGLVTTTALNPASGATQWQNQGVVVSTNRSSNYNAIDPNVVLDAEGTPWLVFGSYWSGIKIIKLDRATGKPAAGAQLLSIASRGGGAIEGAFIIRRGSYYYQFVSFDRCCIGVNSDYNIRVGRSTQVTGPYADSRDIAMMNGGGDLIDRGDSLWRAPGHNGIFVERDTVFLVNHAFDTQNNWDPILWIRPLYWTSQGWPTLDKNLGTIAILRPAEPFTGHRGLPFLVGAQGDGVPGRDARGRLVLDPGHRPALPVFPWPDRR